jgi:hypothetical protein
VNNEQAEQPQQASDATASARQVQQYPWGRVAKAVPGKAGQAGSATPNVNDLPVAAPKSAPMFGPQGPGASRKAKGADRQTGPVWERNL